MCISKLLRVAFTFHYIHYIYFYILGTVISISLPLYRHILYYCYIRTRSRDTVLKTSIIYWYIVSVTNIIVIFLRNIDLSRQKRKNNKIIKYCQINNTFYAFNVSKSSTIMFRNVFLPIFFSSVLVFLSTRKQFTNPVLLSYYIPFAPPSFFNL